MSTRQIRRRVEKLEERYPRKDPNSYTLEELFRKMWREDKENYMRETKKWGWPMTRYIPQFEQEDAERATSHSESATIPA